MNEADRSPALGRPSFKCPHCDAFTSQTWFSLAAMERRKDQAPSLPEADQHEKRSDFPDIPEKSFASFRAAMIDHVARMRSGKVYVEAETQSIYGRTLNNVWLSSCFVCNEFALWLGAGQIFPPRRLTVAPHPDLPLKIYPDFEEARAIVATSPRGAAALLRLAVQKLCQELGLPGKDLNKDIGALVAKGLPVRIQQALDAVRVVGNEQVHPGELDLRDNPEIAAHLFELVNMIVDDRITKPKALDALYARLPKGKLDGISQRDAPKT